MTSPRSPVAVDLGELARLAEEATKPLWLTWPATLGPRDDPMTAGDVGIIANSLPSQPGRLLPLVGEVFAERERGHPDVRQALADATYIVALVNAAPALIAELRAARSAAADAGKLREALRRSVHQPGICWDCGRLLGHMADCGIADLLPDDGDHDHGEDPQP